ncbi:MAG: NAD(P)/FAD-dependent oxidoreductase [Proteobacteria bacterium]|nr:NAD(P)/FAD-dependent oxidoreductase [Pseudomonadota bacterium]
MNHYDTIIIGAGHNGLICAAYLARSGQRVLVLEASDTLGGMAAPREFHPGFKTSVAHSVSQFSAKITRDLDLEAHGFKLGKTLTTVGLNDAGEHVVLQDGAVSGVGPDDASAYADYRQMMQRFAGVLNPVWLQTMPRIGNNNLSEILTFASIGLRLRLLGKDHMREFLRVAALPARDLMDENFDSELLKAVLGWDGLIGSRMAPRSPNGAVLVMLYRMSGALSGDHAIPNGGVGGLITSLHSSAVEAGVEVRTGSRVGRILIQADESGLAATGVELADGEQIMADRVVSAADPKTTFFDLVGVQNLEIEFTNRIRRLRCDGYVAKLHLALDGLPAFDGLERPDGRMIIAPDMDSIEFAFDDAKYGESAGQPVMEIVIPSLQDASLAPNGQHVLSAHVMYVPYRLKGGWTDEAREALCERAIDTIARYAPGIRKQILHRELLTPLDLERTCNVTGGHWHHTEFAMDQMLMMRPTYDAAQYSTPIPGLYLCGAGSHPGGGLMGGPGHNAAHEILK